MKKTLKKKNSNFYLFQLINTTDTIGNDNLESTEIPKSPRCLAIMSAQNRRDRLSTLITLQDDETCQTQLSCLMNIDKMIKFEELSNAISVQTNNPTKIERQIQVDTIKGHFDDLCQVRIDIPDRIGKDSTVDVIEDEKILQALTDRDGKLV